MFNPAELATHAEAAEIAAKLSAGPVVVGGGVKPVSDDNAKSGIFLPNWEGGPAAAEEPHGVDAKGQPTYWLHFRFQNGAEGVNVGLVRDRFARYPNSPLYVVMSLKSEVDSLVGGF